jgi:AMP nucleosidase
MMQKVLYARDDGFKVFDDPKKAVDFVREIYETNTDFLRSCFYALVEGGDVPDRVSACYPCATVEIHARELRRDTIDPKLSYGFVSQEGIHSTTLTRPDLFSGYYEEMLKAVMQNHGVPVKIGVGNVPIPIHFAFAEGMHFEKSLDGDLMRKFEEVFDFPHLSYIDDRIVDNEAMEEGKDIPLAFYTAPRVDVSLQRLRHYTGTDPRYFQKFVLFTNYQFYVDEFRTLALDIMESGDDPAKKEGHRAKYTSFVEPGNRITYNQNIDRREPTGEPAWRMPQMPAYHLTRPGGSGITLVNIGVGPSNAKTISDHIAVLRPHAAIMVGHCGGLRSEMKLGDYVLAHAYDRRDLVLDSKLPANTAIPALAEIQLALANTVHKVTGKQGDEVRDIMRTGTVLTVADRNWEFDGYNKILASLKLSRAVAVDMEAGTLAANWFRHRVPYGTLLCVSDKPLHGAIKMPGPSEEFYRRSVKQHIRIGIETCEYLCRHPEGLHSRKLRNSFDPAFR